MGNAPHAQSSSSRGGNLPGFKMLGGAGHGGGGNGGGGGKQASQEQESQQTPPGRLPTHSPPSATAKAAEHPSGPSAPAKAEAPAGRAAKIDDCMDVPAAEKAAEADAEEFLKARQKRESTKAKEPKPKVLKRPAAISDGNVKEWRSKHHKQVIPRSGVVGGIIRQRRYYITQAASSIC